jgi:hypothetical protein
LFRRDGEVELDAHGLADLHDPLAVSAVSQNQNLK